MTDEPDHRARIAGYLDRFGRDRNLSLPPLDADGVGSVQRGSAVVQIHVLVDKGVLLLLAKVAAASPTFALHPKTGDLYLRILRSLDGLDYEEFEDVTHTIATVADEWDTKLARELGRA